MVKLLGLGDSFTAGQAVEPHERFLNQLGDMLKSHGAGNPQVSIVAKGGWKSETLKGALDQAIPGLNVIDPEHGKVTYNFDIVTLLVGVNDITIGTMRDTFTEQYEMLLRRAITLTGNRPKRVVALNLPAYGFSPDAHNPRILNARQNCAMVRLHMKSIPDYNTPQGIRATVERYNSAIAYTVDRLNKTFPEDNKINLVDIFSITKALPMKETESGSLMHLPEHFDAQGVHYKPEMYTKWAEAILPHALRALKLSPEARNATVH